MKVHGLLATLVLALLCACAPHREPLPEQARVDDIPAQWRLPANGAAPVGQWWQGFDDPALATLVERALVRNTDLLIGAERLDAAREQIRLSRAALLPSLDAVFGLKRNQELGPFGPTRASAAQPGLQLSYEADLWGRLARLRQVATLQYQASEAEQQTLRLAVAATVAQGYVALLSLDRQLALTRETVQSRRAALSVAEDRARMGYTSELELTQARSEYEATAQLVPQLEQAIVEQEHALRRLTGDLPGPVARGTLAALHPPPVPGSLPSTLLRQRPDLYQAERQLAASDRFLDSERDRFLPRVQLSASLGRLYVNALDYDPLTVWSLGASMLAPLFDGQRLEAGVALATAERNQAAYAYRAAVLGAFSEVENALSGLDRLASQSARVKARRNILARSLEIAEDRYHGGYSSYLEALDAQRNLFDTELAEVQLQEARLNQLIQLYRALGGGWQAPEQAAAER
ncbi:efflux transporter outer membrane subunit [Pseudomonas stutzeri]|uniref:efflux transporter outer membrane subunit n=1 Tax=Stutzerimonas stutzeri TaxID=316 RepID=UPI00190B3814|nr:efflux transporter outer membrane subunit [Stutzerimonas stutzeri]MBK3866452.1 efflux transporter outer membrane subunit [Stutzerimonas stutzeri]